MEVDEKKMSSTRDASIRIFAADTEYRFLVMWSVDTDADSDALSFI